MLSRLAIVLSFSEPMDHHEPHYLDLLLPLELVSGDTEVDGVLYNVLSVHLSGSILMTELGMQTANGRSFLPGVPVSAQHLTAANRCRNLTSSLDTAGVGPPWILVGHSYGRVLVR